MDKQSPPATEDELSTWLSTYGLVTVERIFSQLGLHLKYEELVHAIHDSTNIYFEVLRVPFKNILNGIILNQAMDYREFAQKLFIDFLLSGSANDSETTPASESEAKEALEAERLHLITLGDEFDLQDFECNKLIAESQKALIALSHEKLKKKGEITEDDRRYLVDHIAPFVERAQALNEILRQYRKQFYELVLRTKQMIETLPNYRPDTSRLAENLSALHFDPKIGEESQSGSSH